MEEVPERVGLVAVVVVVGVEVLVVGGEVLVVGFEVLVVGLEVLVVGVEVLVVVGLVVVGEVGVSLVMLVDGVAGVVELEVVPAVVEFVHWRLATVASVLAPWLRFARKVLFTDGGRLPTAFLKLATALVAASQLPALTADETASS